MNASRFIVQCIETFMSSWGSNANGDPLVSSWIWHVWSTAVTCSQCRQDLTKVQQKWLDHIHLYVLTIYSYSRVIIVFIVFQIFIIIIMNLSQDDKHSNKTSQRKVVLKVEYVPFLNAGEDVTFVSACSSRSRFHRGHADATWILFTI